MNSQDVVIIIPAYNEEATIAETVKEYVEVFPSAKIVVVDNNSKDATSERARAAIRPDRDEVIFEGRQGKGNAVRAGFSRFTANAYMIVDADLSHRAEDAKALLEYLIEHRVDMMVGDRLSNQSYSKHNTRIGHGFGNKVLSFYISAISGTKYNDVMSGMRVLSSAFVDSLDFRATGFQIETEMNVRAAYLRVDTRELEISFVARPENTTPKLNTIRDGIRIVFFAFTNWLGLYPIYFFGLLSLFCFLVSSVSGFFVIERFLQAGHVDGIATAVLSAAFGIVGVVSLFTGLTLQVLVRSIRSADIARFMVQKRIWNLAMDARANRQGEEKSR